MADEGFITMQEATYVLGLTRQTVLQRVKRGEIEATHVTKGGKRGLRIKVIDRQPNLFRNH
jgi:excisionase family DNA binding protein